MIGFLNKLYLKVVPGPFIRRVLPLTESGFLWALLLPVHPGEVQQSAFLAEHMAVFILLLLLFFLPAGNALLR